MLRMYMSEKMQPGLDCCYAAEKFFRTVMDIVVKVEDAERRCVGDENIRVFRNICIMLGLAVRDAVAHEHWDTIEFHTVNFHSGIAQVMDITVKPVNGGTVKTVIVVAANEYLLRIRKVAEPVHEKLCNRLWQPCVSEICNIFISNVFFADKDKRLLAQFAIQAETIPLLYIKVRHEEDTFAVY